MDLKLGQKKIIHAYLIIFSYFITVQVADAQIYGLEFQGDNFVLDRRTELDLTPDKFFKFKGEFEISFDFKAIRTNPNSNAGLFGYIFRVIDNDDNNIDLVSRSPNPQFGLNLVIGKSHKIIPLEYTDEIIKK